MEKKKFVTYLEEIFNPIGFKRKGNNWIAESEELIKIIKLERSKYSNRYYLNYGYNLKDLELPEINIHVSNQLGSFDDFENERINALLDFENDFTDEQRKKELLPLIENNMINELKEINSKQDLMINLKNRPHLNDIPYKVKEYLNLS